VVRLVAEKFILSYRTNQLRLAIHKSHCLPNYIVSVNSKRLGSITIAYKVMTAFYDLILTNFHRYNIVLIIYFDSIGRFVISIEPLKSFFFSEYGPRMNSSVNITSYQMESDGVT
jgi:hypothetical protein